MMLNRLTGRERVLLFVTLSVLTSVLLCLYIFEPVIGGWKHLDKEIAHKELALKRNRLIIAERKSVIEEYERISKIITMKGSPENEMGRLLSEIEELSRGSFTITNIRPRVFEDKGFYTQFIAEVEGQSDVKGLVKFIYELEDPSHLLKVRRIRIASKRRTSGGVVASMLISKILMP